MVTKGLLVRLEVKAGNDAMAEDVLRSALPMVRAEAATTAWFAIRFGRSEYGMFDVFPDDAGREAHLAGPVTQALLDAGGSVFAGAPLIQEPRRAGRQVACNVIGRAGHEGTAPHVQGKGGP
ncbi:putative quinol monooxygenase [Paraburkholderia xenovorans]|uniref:putative quinol monooxygenase n=1 Tax=Paraburkholderia xenovorans TaxID=36873 RepID=UPI0038BB8D10